MLGYNLVCDQVIIILIDATSSFIMLRNKKNITSKQNKRAAKTKC